MINKKRGISIQISELDYMWGKNNGFQHAHIYRAGIKLLSGQQKSLEAVNTEFSKELEHLARRYRDLTVRLFELERTLDKQHTKVNKEETSKDDTGDLQ